MLIAQHSVAGEGVLHPLPVHDDSVDTDQTALDEFLAGQSNLPWVVFRAAHRAANFPTLPARARAVLAALARTVDANNPYASIFARRELLTGRAMQSMRTFYRSLDDLEAAGLIERAPQKRYGTAGLFGRAYLHLTERSAIVLGYIATANEIETTEIDHSSGNDHNTSASTFGTPCASVADGAIYKDLFPKNQKRQPGRLPADLERLLSLGFREFLIFKLMREAKMHAKLLSDVVEATWVHLKQAKHPISYLRALLRSSVDFGHQIRAKRTVEDKKARENARRAQIEATVRQCVGQVFIDADETRLVEVSCDGQSITVHSHREVSPRVAAVQWNESFAAAIKGNVLKQATPQQIIGFKDKCPQGAVHPNAAHAAKFTFDQPRNRTADISGRLSEMKRTLRAACAGVARVSKSANADNAPLQDRVLLHANL
ncbi:hypothetical protein ASG35_10905 [Burkholderia sp. Leaf177]|uniref:hypothetical protein n=1 Tax=Burkholderia sp. Leaf177 TaxID=1736287 RepID=UPI0006F9EE7F|nr:hypothetical protein [Burkholderia sp. Leaf177]KQR78866.1 hypothetical protein ASG35_10905 [Burkholderia sp. Leaf177]